MEDDRLREPGVHQLRHPRPRDPILLAATTQRAPPEVGDMVPERDQCTGIGRHGVVVSNHKRLDIAVTTPAVHVRKLMCDYTDDEYDRVADLNL